MGTGLSSLGSLKVRGFLGFRVGPEQYQLSWEWWSHTWCVLKCAHLALEMGKAVARLNLFRARASRGLTHRDCLALNFYSPPTCCAALNNIPSL